MIKLGWTFLVLATLYFAGVCIYGWGIQEGMKKNVTQASCQQYIIDAQQKWLSNEVFIRQCVQMLFDKPITVRGEK